MHLFHCPDLTNDLAVLPEEEAHHAVHVLRLRVGDRIGLLDGRGTRAEGVLVEASKRGCTARVDARTVVPADPAGHIHLAVAPTKQMERFEWFLEKATEIGVGRITPLLTARTERSRLRTDRMERILLSAMKQSQRTWLPHLDAPMALADVARLGTAQRFFGWCEGEHRAFSAAYDPTRDALMLIGPEGDFTTEEADRLRASGFVAVSLGAARLRTETAAVAACAWMDLAGKGGVGKT